MKQRRPSKCIKKTSWFMLYSGILYINSKISPKNVRYKRSTKVARARKVVERSLLSSKGPEAPVLHEGRARARARAKYPGHFRPAKKTSSLNARKNIWHSEHLFKKVKNNRRKTHEIFFYFFLKLHIFRLSGGVSCWHLPYQKSMCPSRIRTFRRSLPQLGTACNLRF